MNITMPQLGESVTEGTIGQWLVREGERIDKYEPLCEVITDKVNAEIPSSYTGIVHQIVAGEGQTVAVGETICIMESVEEEAGHADAGQEETGGAEAAAALHQRDDHRANQLVHQLGGQQGMEQPDNGASVKRSAAVTVLEKRKYSPAVKKLARDHDLDLSNIQGTGRGGRITKQDVLAYMEQKASGRHDDLKGRSNLETDEPTALDPELLDDPLDIIGKHPTEQPGDRLVPLTPVRRAIAQKLSHAKQEVPHAWMMIEVDVTELVSYREKMKNGFREREGINLTYLPFFIRAVVDGLREYPAVNSQWDHNRIIQKKEINISLSVGTDDALFVPVIHHADEKSILGLARSVHELAVKTREGKLTQDDVQGGTFTVNNTGSFGSIQSQPILNYPQAAILSIESIVKRPVIKDNMIAIRDMVNLCLSLDHRVLDGVICGKFLQSVKKKLEYMGEGMEVD